MVTKKFFDWLVGQCQDRVFIRIVYEPNAPDPNGPVQMIQAITYCNSRDKWYELLLIEWRVCSGETYFDHRQSWAVDLHGLLEQWGAMQPTDDRCYVEKQALAFVKVADRLVRVPLFHPTAVQSLGVLLGYLSARRLDASSVVDFDLLRIRVQGVLREMQQRFEQILPLTPEDC